MARSARDGKGSWPQLAAFVVDGRTTTRRMFPEYELGRSDEPQRSHDGDTTSTAASSVTYGIGRLRVRCPIRCKAPGRAHAWGLAIFSRTLSPSMALTGPMVALVIGAATPGAGNRHTDLPMRQLSSAVRLRLQGRTQRQFTNLPLWGGSDDGRG